MLLFFNISMNYIPEDKMKTFSIIAYFQVNQIKSSKENIPRYYTFSIIRYW